LLPFGTSGGFFIRRSLLLQVAYHTRKYPILQWLTF